MYKLYHYFLCPSSRFIRLVLEENKIAYQTQLENYWNPQKEFLLLNPAGHLPVLIDTDNYPLIGANVCMEYLNNLNFKLNLMNGCYKQDAEIRRIFHWFEYVFKKEVLDPLLYEKVFTRVIKNINPNSNNIRSALQNLSFHKDYINYLLKNNDWIVGENFTYADVIASANFSVLDYLGLLDFGKSIYIKEWYVKIKSRPSFKVLLNDDIVGIPPDNNYKTIDL
jgi:glutathione S-transferase